ncbi:MAG: family 78 glycoside hydrolase catalytic domain [Abditibacteriota bacterium]|nr:family 78 glycoside hydrolase catalytic domain [Abditibacteriota bacterium]
MNLTGSWIWTKDKTPEFNRFVRFRKTFSYSGGKADLEITADTRYALYVNGEFLGFGPGRCWANHYNYDIYDISPYLQKGENLIAVLVNHYNTSTFQYISTPEGLYCELSLENETIVSDNTFKAQKDSCYVSETVRISCQESFEEIFDASNDDGWRDLNYDDSSWDMATQIRPAKDGIHNNLEYKNIPNLTFETVCPQKIISYETVKSCDYFINLNIKEAIFPNNRNSNFNTANFCIGTSIESDKECDITFRSIPLGIVYYLNGDKFEPKASGINEEFSAKGQLKGGKNDFIIHFSGSNHWLNFQIAIECEAKLSFKAGNGEFALIGPFELSEEQINTTKTFNDPEAIQNILYVKDENVSQKVLCEYLKSPKVDKFKGTPYFKVISQDLIPKNSPFIVSYTDTATGNLDTKPLEYLLGNNTWTTIEPNEGGDVRICLDYGKALTGYETFEIVATEGIIIDFHNFEFIQPDGRFNFAEGMTNSFRYITKEGRQSYKTFQIRGFRYTYITFRNLIAPIKIRSINATYSAYQQNNQGSFICSDYLLNKMWEIGANTMRACALDTYVDCPTYEQTLWVGDARNESLVDYAVNGDNRLWLRWLRITGQSLERSPITESQVPSGWQNILPAWTFLWMRSCVEYYKFTGDKDGAKDLMTYLIKNAEGLKSFINDLGLFYIRAWNMFDWAAMDTPAGGASITHNNCFAVLALNETAGLAESLGYNKEANEWRALANSIKDAINKYMWNEEMNAYTDCIRGTEHSKVYSQQTHTVAYMSGVAEGERAVRSKEILYNPPKGFVKAGSPFYEFFLLEALQNDNRATDFLNIMRRDWGFMLDKGATSFWELWSMGTKEGDRLTRSHCHGWSSAPTYFLSSFILGIKPAEPGFKKAIINPHFGDLKWARGSYPTPHGNIKVEWKKLENGEYDIKVDSPVPYKIVIP